MVKFRRVPIRGRALSETERAQTFVIWGRGSSFPTQSKRGIPPPRALHLCGSVDDCFTVSVHSTTSVELTNMTIQTPLMCLVWPCQGRTAAACNEQPTSLWTSPKVFGLSTKVTTSLERWSVLVLCWCSSITWSPVPVARYGLPSVHSHFSAFYREHVTCTCPHNPNIMPMRYKGRLRQPQTCSLETAEPVCRATVAGTDIYMWMLQRDGVDVGSSIFFELSGFAHASNTRPKRVHR